MVNLVVILQKQLSRFEYLCFRFTDDTRFLEIFLCPEFNTMFISFGFSFQNPFFNIWACEFFLWVWIQWKIKYPIKISFRIRMITWRIGVLGNVCGRFCENPLDGTIFTAFRTMYICLIFSTMFTSFCAARFNPLLDFFACEFIAHILIREFKTIDRIPWRSWINCRVWCRRRLCW